VKLFLSILLCFSIVACKPDDDKTVAKVNGESITIKDLKEDYPELDSHLFKIKEAKYKALSSFAERAIGDRILKAEAKKQGIAEDELIKKEVQGKIKAATDKQARDFAKMRGMKEKDLEKIGIDKVKNFLDMQQERAATGMYMKQLMAKNNVEIKLEAPKKPKVEIKVSKDDIILGNKDSDVVFVEFYSFTCPHCKNASKGIHKLIDEYKEKVKFVFKPLGGENLAAEAAMCAHEKGKFAEYEEILFSNSRKLDNENLIKYADKIGLNKKDFSNCLNSRKYQDRIKANSDESGNAGVEGVPTAFVNGEAMIGASYEKLKSAIEKEL
jgi:protein-disulfide isomerase